jgi:hypothetical protein
MDPISLLPPITNMQVARLEVEVVTVTTIRLSTTDNLDFVSGREISFYHERCEIPFYTETYVLRYATILVAMAIIC